MEALTRLPQLRDRLIMDNDGLSADESADLDQLGRTVPRLLSLLPDVLPDRTNVRHNSALTEMTNKLVYHLDRAKPLAIVRLHSQCCTRMSLVADPRNLASQSQTPVRTPFFAETTRTKNIQSAMYEKFLRTVEVA